MFHSFFNSMARFRHSSFFSLSFNFTLSSAGTAKSTFQQDLFFIDYFSIWSSGRLAEIRWCVYILKSHKSLSVSFSRTDPGLFTCHLFVWPNFIFQFNSQWITFPSLLCLVLYPFCANLHYSLIMWFIVSSISRYNYPLQFCYV